MELNDGITLTKITQSSTHQLTMIIKLISMMKTKRTLMLRMLMVRKLSDETCLMILINLSPFFQ